MDRETWDQLLGRLREELIKRGRDPELNLEANWEEKEIRLPNARAGEDDSEPPWDRALSMVRAAGLARESRE